MAQYIFGHFKPFYVPAIIRPANLVEQEKITFVCWQRVTMVLQFSMKAKKEGVTPKDITIITCDN